MYTKNCILERNPDRIKTRKQKMSEITNYKCVIFDMDGTILDTTDDITKSVNLTLEEFGYPGHSAKEVVSYLNNGAVKLIERALPVSERNIENVLKVHKRYLEIYSEHVCEKTHAYEGIPDLFRKMKSVGIKLAVVSNKPYIQTKILTDKCFSKGTFDYVSGSGEGFPTKPDKACIDRALEVLKVDKKDVLYVGDSYVDVLTAKKSGITCAGVLWGFAGENSFTEHKPDYMVKDANQLEKLVFPED